MPTACLWYLSQLSMVQLLHHRLRMPSSCNLQPATCNLQPATCTCVQGVTEPLEELPAELAQGCWMLLGPLGVSVFLGTLERDRVFWFVGFHACEDGADGWATLVSSAKTPVKARPPLLCSVLVKCSLLRCCD